MYSNLPLKFNPPSPTGSSAISSASSYASSSVRQLRFELQQAVNRSMVLTRSHDQTPAKTSDGEFQSEAGSTITKKRKRNAIPEVGRDHSNRSAQRKQRERRKPNPDRTATAVLIQGKAVGEKEQKIPVSHSSHIQNSGANSARSKSFDNEVTSPTGQSGGRGFEPSGTQSESIALTHRESEKSWETEVETPQLPSGDASFPGKSGSRKKKRKLADATLEPAEPTVDPANQTDTPTTQPAKRRHKRFESQEPDGPSPTIQPDPEVTTPPPQLSQIESDSSDDDEAPETVTASAGQIQARKKSLDEAKAAARLKADHKLKRKERDRQMKAQAKTVKIGLTLKDKVDSPNLHTTHLEEIPDEDAAPPSPPHQKSTNSAKPSLPTLLPAHILTDTPPPPHLNQRPRPPPSSTQPHPSNKNRKFLDPDPKPPKDLKQGRVRIRVLEERNGILPPKASVQGKALREAWLMGRGVERRKVGGKGGWKGGGGFVRRVG